MEYYNRSINTELYSTIEVMGNPGNRTTRPLTREEFRMGYNGMVFMDNTTNKIVFAEDRNKKIHMVDIAQLEER